MLEALTVAFFKIHPTLRQEAVRVREDGGVDVLKDGRHANNGLRRVRSVTQLEHVIIETRSAIKLVELNESRKDGKAYSGWNFPIFIVEGSVTWKTLMASDFSGAKPIKMTLAGSSGPLGVQREYTANPL